MKKKARKAPQRAIDKQGKALRRRTWLLVAVSFVLALGITILGIIAGGGEWFKAHRGICVALLVTACAVPAAIGVWSFITAKRIYNKLNSMRIEEVRNFVLNERSNALETMESSKKELKRLRVRAYALGAAILLLAAAIAFFAGVLISPKGAIALFFLYSMMLFIAVLSRIPRDIPTAFLEEDKTFVSRSDFPALYSIAEGTAKSMGLNDELRIALFPDGNFAVIKVGEYVLLRIGIYALVQMNEKELESVISHELSHIINENKNDPEKKFALREAGFSDLGFEGLGSILFARVDADHDLKYETYRFACSVLFEEEADRAMTRNCDNLTAASALIKINYTDLYRFEYAYKGEDRYEGEEPMEDEVSRGVKQFSNALKERKEFWDRLIPKEIMSRTSSHPTCAMRIKALGLDECRTVEEPAGEALRTDIENAIKYLDSVVRETRLEDYSERRKEFHDKPLELIEKWKSEGEPVTAEGYREIVDALLCAGRAEEALSLCDRVIAALPGHAAHYAVYTKGNSMLHEYDDEGIEYLYRAIETNNNYVEDALDEIGQYCCLTGNEKELERYRERSLEIMQKNMDEYGSIHGLARGDDLSAEHLPEGALERDLAYFASVDDGTIDRIYLVRKTVPNGFFTSAYVIKFKKGTDPEKTDEVMDKLFNYLDTVSDWQYSLFTWEDVSSSGIDRIEGTLVYERKN